MRVRRATTDFRRSAERKNHVHMQRHRKEIISAFISIRENGERCCLPKIPPPCPLPTYRTQVSKPFVQFLSKKNWKNKREKKKFPPLLLPLLCAVEVMWTDARNFPTYLSLPLSLRYSVAAARNLIYSPNYYTEFFPENAAWRKEDRKYRRTVGTNAAFFSISFGGNFWYQFAVCSLQFIAK